MAFHGSYLCELRHSTRSVVFWERLLFCQLQPINTAIPAGLNVVSTCRYTRTVFHIALGVADTKQRRPIPCTTRRTEPIIMIASILDPPVESQHFLVLNDGYSGIFAPVRRSATPPGQTCRQC